MKLFNIGDILLIHNELINRYGGIHGVRDGSVLKYATQKPYMTAFGEDLFPKLTDKLASFLESIIKNHPFNDGNKRTAYHVIKDILTKKGYRVNLSYDEARPFLVKIVTENVGIDEISDWLNSLVSNSINEEQGDFDWIDDVPTYHIFTVNDIDKFYGEAFIFFGHDNQPYLEEELMPINKPYGHYYLTKGKTPGSVGFCWQYVDEKELQCDYDYSSKSRLFDLYQSGFMLFAKNYEKKMI